jgi:hypothetical protein
MVHGNGSRAHDVPGFVAEAVPICSSEVSNSHTVAPIRSQRISFGFRRPRALSGYRYRCSGSHSCPRISGRKTYPRRRRTSESVARSTSLRMNFRHGSKASANRPSRGAVAARPSPIESCAVGTERIRAVANSASLRVISRPIDRPAGECIVRASPASDAR